MLIDGKSCETPIKIMTTLEAEGEANQDRLHLLFSALPIQDIALTTAVWLKEHRFWYSIMSIAVMYGQMSQKD